MSSPSLKFPPMPDPHDRGEYAVAYLLLALIFCAGLLIGYAFR